ncbi:hypothetical protein WDW37_09270 [Bdellovibrionota bacterium FG-1]
MTEPGLHAVFQKLTLDSNVRQGAHSYVMSPTSNRKGKQKPKKPALKAHVPFSSPELCSAKLVAETLLECIKTGDLESFRDVLSAHLMVANKMQLAKKAGLGRRTLYDLVDRKQNFNPELSTVSAIIRGLAS